MLTVEGLRCGYGRIEALHGVSIKVEIGEIVTLVGANGAGKTTLLRAISGVQPITSGQILFDGVRIERIPAHVRVARGIAQVPEGRQLFTSLTVEDNLALGAWSHRAANVTDDLQYVYQLFPIIAERRKVPAGMLSGGQQQMLAISRALMAKPRLLLLDEPSMGLAPILVDQILHAVQELKRKGLTVLLVEQNARAALTIADRGYVLETGQITAAGAAQELLSDRRVQAAYLGV